MHGVERVTETRGGGAGLAAVARGRSVKWGMQASCVKLDADTAMHVDAGIRRFIRNTCEMHGVVLGKNHD